MHIYTIKKLLNIPEYKVTEIISATSKEIHIRLEAYKRKKAICSGCGKVHKVGCHGDPSGIVQKGCDRRCTNKQEESISSCKEKTISMFRRWHEFCVLRLDR